MCNGNFETRSSLPTGVGQIRNACSWGVPNTSTPDYLANGSQCIYTTAPCTGAFGAAPLLNFGTAYAGINIKKPMIPTADVDNSEYIIGHLRQPLIAGKSYTLKLYILRSGRFQYSLNNFGAYLSQTSPSVAGNVPLTVTPQLVETSTISSTAWVQLTFPNYIATGGEEYVTLGFFPSVSPTPSPIGCLPQSCGVTSCNTADQGAYYFIDEVSLLPSTSITASPSSTICAGTNVTLTATGLSSYTWSPGGQTTSSIIVSPSINTTYTVQGTDGNGCLRSLTLSVTVNPTPNVIVNSVTICAGEKADLLATSSISGTFFTWSTGDFGSTLSVTPTVTTTYTVTGNYNGCYDAAVATVTVNNPPQNTGFSVTPNPICEGSQTCFSAFVPNIAGATYTFTDGAGHTVNSADGNNVCFTYPNDGIFYPGLTVSGNGCNSSTIYATLTVEPIKVDVNFSQNCNTATFTAVPQNCVPANAIYEWVYSNGGSIISTGNPVTFAIVPGSGIYMYIFLTIKLPDGTVIYTQSFTQPITPVTPETLCCTLNTECVDLSQPTRVLDTDPIPCTEETWSGPIKHLSGNVTLTKMSITVMPNTTVFIDANASVDFSASTFLMHPGSKIIIDKRAILLKFNKCHLFGCTQLWEGISIENNNDPIPAIPPKVLFQNSVIEDAFVAFNFANTGNFVNFEITHATINKCITGIKAMTLTNSNNVNRNTFDIDDVVFTCKEYSLSMNPGFFQWVGESFYNAQLKFQNDDIPLPKTGLAYHQRSMTGLVLIGDYVGPNTYKGNTTLISANQNLIFDNLAQGIVVTGLSMPEFTKNKFTNIKSPVNGGNSDNYYTNKTAAILFNGKSWTYSGGPAYTVNKVGANVNSAPFRNKFNDCYQGVYAKDEPVDVTYNDFTDCYNGVYESNANAPANVSISIKGNNMIRLKSVGVLMDKNLSIDAEIFGNNVNNTSGLNFTSLGVYLVETNQPTSAKYNVHDNILTKVFNGTRSMGTYEPKFTNNTINLNTNTNPPSVTVNNAPYNSGINIVNCDKTQANENEISNTNNSFTWWEHGFTVFDSQNGKYYCNDVNGTFSGYTTGSACGGTQIFHNDIHNAKFAHWLMQANVLGDQFNPYSTPGIQPADNRYYNIGNWHSFTQNGTIGIQNAQFYVRSLPNQFVMANNGADLSPPASQPVNILSPSFPVLPFNNLGCAGNGGGNIPNIPNGRLMSLAKQVATDVLFPASDTKGRFMSRKQLLSNLQKENIGTTGDADIDNFTTAINGEAVSKLFNVDILAQKGVENADSTYYLQAETLNGSFIPADSIEKLQQQVNTVYLDYLKKGGILDSASIAILQPIAALCPYRYGTSIWEARAILVGYDNTEYFNLCEYYTEPQDNSNARIAQLVEDVQNAEQNTISIYPNPNTGSFKIELQDLNGEVKIEVVSTMGSLVKQISYNASENRNIVEVQDLPQGLYFVVVKANGIIIGSNKVIVTK